jgi:molybdopterin-containing oxidoreductase family iron-sulfur binding subunit
VRAFDGTVSLIQPLIAPIYDGHQVIEVLSAMNGRPADKPVDLLKDYWSRAFEGHTKATWTLHDQDGKAFASFDHFWRHALHDGFLAGTSLLTAPAASVPAVAASAPAQTQLTGTEIVFRPDPMILDGRYANNAWLQEMPKPLSKVTWDNVAYIGVAMADRLGIPITRPGSQENDLLEIKYAGRTARIPVWVLPGTADDVVVVHFGYGRRKSGRVGNTIGHDVFGLRGSDAPWFGGGATVTKTGEQYLITSTQNHFAMEGRNPVRVVDAEEFRANPKAVEELGPEKPPPTLSLFPPKEYNGNKWGMAIDLNACTGCGVCITACTSENNIAVVGKEQIFRQREMHWIRVDTYYEGNLDAPKTYHQPVPCQQCEDAPCELVCPVAATSHNDEGLNDMVYNRCVGTRYCSNNCPYKVRRFNFMLYSDFSTPELYAQRNPDVTIRSRGVMEKCTYCVQRINHARIDAKTEEHPIKDGTIQTACQQACPAEAITFGNLNDPTSAIAKVVKQDRNYGLLEDLGTRPRTSYLAVVRNPNPALEPKAPAAKGE